MLFVVVEVFGVIYPDDVSFAEGCGADLSPDLSPALSEGEGGVAQRWDSGGDTVA